MTIERISVIIDRIIAQVTAFGKKHGKTIDLMKEVRIIMVAYPG